MALVFFFLSDTASTEIYTYCHTLSLHDALPIYRGTCRGVLRPIIAIALIDDRLRADPHDRISDIDLVPIHRQAETREPMRAVDAPGCPGIGDFRGQVRIAAADGAIGDLWTAGLGPVEIGVHELA